MCYLGGKQRTIQLAQHLIQYFIYSASLLPDLTEATKLRLSMDITQLEFCFNQLGSSSTSTTGNLAGGGGGGGLIGGGGGWELKDLGPVYQIQLYRFRKMIFAKDDELSSFFHQQQQQQQQQEVDKQLALWNYLLMRIYSNDFLSLPAEKDTPREAKLVDLLQGLMEHDIPRLVNIYGLILGKNPPDNSHPLFELIEEIWQQMQR